MALVGLAACGYRAVYSGTPPSVRLTVTSAPHGVAESVAIDAVLQGVRKGLSAEGALAPGASYPRLAVEVIRIDERGRGAIAEAPSPGSTLPATTRGAVVAVVARGWVVERPGAPPTRDTGDIRRAVTYAHDGDPRRDSLARRQAVRAAGEGTGEALARWVLGEPEPASEPL